MLVLILGLLVFFGAHTLTSLRETRSGLITQYGLGAYKGVHSLVSLLGLVLIIWGFASYRAGGLIPVWTPPIWTRHITIALMWFAFVALACMNPAPSRIRGWLRHPMLAGVKIWSLAHLLANGDLGGIILFGSFLAWASYDRVAVKRRGDPGAPRLKAFTRADAIALIVGTLAYVVMMIYLHPLLIGVTVVPM